MEKSSFHTVGRRARKVREKRRRVHLDCQKIGRRVMIETFPDLLANLEPSIQHCQVGFEADRRSSTSFALLREISRE